MSSKRGIRRHECGSKTRFDTQKQARGAIRSLNRHRFTGIMSSYRCGFCGYWHIGHLTKAARRARFQKFNGGE